MKQINFLGLCLIALMSIGASTSNAQNIGDKFKEGKLYYQVTSTSPLEVAAASQNGGFPLWNESDKPKGAISIPSEVSHNGVSFSVTSINGQAFFLCTGITSVSIPSSVTIIGIEAFGECTNLTDIETSVDNSQYSSKDGVLFNKDQTTLVQYPLGKKGEYEIPNSVTTIGQTAFKGCPALTGVIIPNSITMIEGAAFKFCTGLKSVVIPHSVTTIGEGAFMGCSSLNDVTIPHSVTKIKWDAFKGCKKLASITSFIEEVGSVNLGSDVFAQVNTNSCELKVPKGKKNDYQQANQWKDFVNIIEFIPTGIDNINTSANNVWASGGILLIDHKGHTLEATAVVFNLKGECVTSITLQPGLNTVSLPLGLFVVRIANKSYKVVVR